MGDARWSYAGQLPYFRRTETHHDGGTNAEVHGYEGPIHTQSGEGRGYPLSESVRQSLSEIQAKEVLDTNDGFPHGYGPFTENWRHGQRQPAGGVYDLSGVHIETSCTVKSLLLEKSPPTGEATVAVKGATTVHGRTFFARKEVIVCCGAFK